MCLINFFRGEAIIELSNFADAEAIAEVASVGAGPALAAGVEICK